MANRSQVVVLENIERLLAILVWELVRNEPGAERDFALSVLEKIEGNDG